MDTDKSNQPSIFSCTELLALLQRVRHSHMPTEAKALTRDIVLDLAHEQNAEQAIHIQAELYDMLDDYPEVFASYIQKLGQTELAQNSDDSSSKQPVAGSLSRSYGITRAVPVFGSRKQVVQTPPVKQKEQIPVRQIDTQTEVSSKEDNSATPISSEEPLATQEANNVSGQEPQLDVDAPIPQTQNSVNVPPPPPPPLASETQVAPPSNQSEADDNDEIVVPMPPLPERAAPDNSASVDLLRKDLPETKPAGEEPRVEEHTDESGSTPAAAPTNPTPIETHHVASDTADQAAVLDRIREIKAAVNKKVGNPVNLIDVNNDVGREYMNALLGAMKLANGGSPDDLALAMDRLEAAYTDVEKTLSAQPSVVQPDSAVQSTQNNEGAGYAEAQSTPVPPEVTTTEPDKPLSGVEPVIQQPIENEATTDPKQPIDSSVKTAPSVPDANQPKSLAEKLLEERAAREKLTAQNVNKNELEAAQQAEADPLLSNDVTAGLQQLLSEWKLFKSSGLFGTGPNGYEHPLYKTLSALPMASVVSGRFEGMTPEIKQSITDYMNGWRYEQGVVHEMGETFEHYLRRVILAILSKQKKMQK